MHNYKFDSVRLLGVFTSFVRAFLAMVLVSLVAPSCVSFKTASLYDGVVPMHKPPLPDNINLAVEPVIFYDDVTDVWGLEEEICKVAEATSETVFRGERAIRMEWDRNTPGCKWAGIGIGWDGYAGKDLSVIMDAAAISFYVRTVSGRMFSLPFVLTLEDYSGGMGFCYTANKYFERTAIDEEWQQVIVPLADFDLETENLDPSNIKQLQIELQQGGAVFIDHIELIYYTPPPVEPWMVEDERPDPLDLPIVLFDDDFVNQNGWGMMRDECQDFSIITHPEGSKNAVIQAKWNNRKNCHLVKLGVSWNRWFPVDITPIVDRAALTFRMKPKGGAINGQVEVGFEDYDRALAAVFVTETHWSNQPSSSGWYTVVLPLSEFPNTNDKTRIKHLFMGFHDQGEWLIDDLQLVALPSP